MPESLKFKSHLVVNRGPNTLLHALDDGLKNAQRADIAVAFVSLAGLNRILPRLRLVASRGGVRLVVGLYQDITQPSALRVLLAVSQKTKKFSVLISRNRCFHAKFYLLTSGDRVTALVGSSNLSDQGLFQKGELDLRISLPVGSAQQLREEFKEILADTVGLTKELIESYAARYDKIREHGKPKDLPSLSGILKNGKDSEPQKNDEPVTPLRWWRDTVDGYLKPTTERIIRDATDWEAKGWEWHCPGEHKFELRDCVLLLDFADQWAHIATVTAKAEYPTPEGRYFIAWRPNKKFRRRRMTDSFWTEMKDQGLATSKASARNPRRLLGKDLQEAVTQVFGKK